MSTTTTSSWGQQPTTRTDPEATFWTPSQRIANDTKTEHMALDVANRASVHLGDPRRRSHCARPKAAIIDQLSLMP
jgi:hypothetical protein